MTAYTLALEPATITVSGATITPRYGVAGVSGGWSVYRGRQRFEDVPYALRIATQPLLEPVTLAQAKARCNITSSDDDDIVTALIVSARQAAEAELGRALIAQVWTLTLDCFPDAPIRLHWPPILSVDAVEYREYTSGDWLTLSAVSYIVDSAAEPGYLQPAYGYEWPVTYPETNAVRVTYSAGYGNTADDVPQAIRDWMCLMVGHYYKNREASDVNTLAPLPFIGGLLDRYRIPGFGT